MSPLSISKAALAAIFLFFCTSFKPRKAHSFFNRDTYYYWYLDSGTVYNDWTSTANEITQLEETYGVYVDEDPVDGTLIASGYGVEGYPHDISFG
jgi:hypothetical protein